MAKRLRESGAGVHFHGFGFRSVARQVLVIAVLACLTGSRADDREPADAAPAVTEAALFPRLHGRISVTGEVPVFPPFVHCDCGEPVPDERVLVGPDGGLANCIIFLKQVPEGAEVPAAPEEPLIVELAGCRFTPHVSLLRCGQTVVYRYPEDVAHNVHVHRFASPQVSHLASPGEDHETSYERPERWPIPLRCDIHPFMSGYHMVLDHPWCAITDENGNFVISGLPEGELEFVAWHERKGYIARSFTIQVEAGSDIERNFEVAASDLAD